MIAVITYLSMQCGVCPPSEDRRMAEVVPKPLLNTAPSAPPSALAEGTIQRAKPAAPPLSCFPQDLASEKLLCEMRQKNDDYWSKGMVTMRATIGASSAPTWHL